MKRQWLRKAEGYVSGAFSEVVHDLFIFKEKRDGAVSAIVALRDNGKLAWERAFERNSVWRFLSHGRSLYLEGPLARRLDAATGETRAERDLGTRVTPRPGPRWAAYRGTEPPFLVGLDLDALGEVWRVPDGLRWDVHDDFLCSYDEKGTIQFLDPSTMQVSAPVQAPPREAGGRGHAHVGDLWCSFADRTRIGISIRSGTIVWRKDESHFGFHHTPEFVGEMCYAGDRGLSAYDLKTGELVWRQDFGQDTGWLSSSPRVVRGHIYVGSRDGAFHVVDAGSGRLLLSHSTNFEPLVVLPLGSDRIIVGGQQEIACFCIS